MKRILTVLIASFLLMSCTEKKDVDNVILIEISSNNEIRIEGELVPNEKINDVLISQLEALKNSEVSTEDIITRLEVNRKAKMGVVSAIQQAMRELRLHKVEYMSKN